MKNSMTGPTYLDCVKQAYADMAPSAMANALESPAWLTRLEELLSSLVEQNGIAPAYLRLSKSTIASWGLTPEQVMAFYDDLGLPIQVVD